MKAGVNGYRGAISVGIVLLVLLLTAMLTSLLTELRTLAIAEDDNTHWSISQLDTEFANLNAILSRQLSDGDLSDDQIRLRLDIAISRLAIINSGRAAQLFQGSEAAGQLIEPINSFSEQAIAISDAPGPLTESDIRVLRNLTETVRPDVRSIALLGVERSALRAEQNRADFARQISLTGGIAVGLLLLMGVLLLLMDRMLRRAVDRDAQLRTSSELLKATVAASLDAIVTSDENGNIIEFNPAAEDVLGWKRKEIIGQSMEHTFVPHRMRDAHRKGMARYLETGRPRLVDQGRVEMCAVRKSGEEFPVEMNITATQDSDGTQFIAYIRDISERNINEQKLIDARDRAERTDKAKSKFLTVMSHEMRTPLNGILGVLELLKTTPLSDGQERYVDIATASSEILLEHVNEALDITRIEAGTLKLTPQDFHLADLMQATFDALEPLAREKGLQMEMRIDAAMRRGFRADSARLRQILTNLIGNAVKFTDTGKISLEVTGIHGPDLSSLKFAVHDTGAGITPEKQERIFEDFVVLAHGDGRQSRGDGLGLSISRRIARQMGGDISVSSSVGQGATFTLTLPLERIEQRTAPRPALPETAVRGDGASRLVLIVEDNTINRKVLGDMLQTMGHRVVEAVNGADGLQRAAEQPFDLVIMDISMPVMDGLEATARLRADPGPNAETPIVGLTAHGRQDYQQQAHDAGMNQLHSKPIRLSVLRTILLEVTASRAPVPEDVPESAPQHAGEHVPEKVPEQAHEHGPDPLAELRSALGTDKLAEIGGQFYAEMDAFIDESRSGVLDDARALAEAAHKMKGAAAMLGQSTLETPLAALEEMARAQAVTDLPGKIDALEKTTALARTRFAVSLALGD